MTGRRLTVPIRIGSVTVGGKAPIVVQSMTNTDTRDVAATLRQINELVACGCEIVRLAVPDDQAARALALIRREVSIPLVADIHFDHRLALAALEAGVDGLRLNPGNIGRREHVAAVVQEAKRRQVPIRIGVNAGSLPKPVGEEQSLPITDRMVEAAMRHIEILEDLDFDLIKVSLKAFDVPTTVEAYEKMSERRTYPLHLGITEAGTTRAGSIRSAVGIGVLLSMGIGDTIRVSLTADPKEEVFVAYEILKSLNLRDRGAVMISCPTCGRTEIDLIGLANAVEARLQYIDKPIKVAVMGCVVNGPGEAKDADVGVAGGSGRAVIFRKGEIVKTVDEAEIFDALMKEIETVAAEE
ncbi:MAG: flavodoxin-dependent (E)-4-hydroxy-3-methylbut-2-enyl-diphosphate synthase [Dehalococcoidia bacterium]|nr:flavodoxin-dependent (E)-4-hydroxy-3-methylbut-2-enyl-diphosphate synthase [Dehalococcoidia bacterium]